MDYMEQALTLARLAHGQVSPNPAVGAVLIKNDTIIGQGYTQPPGGHHAEIVAIQQAGAATAGSTLYVTLEPCTHFGRTPPCSDAIIKSGVAAVHMAMIDPNPLVAGRGKAALEVAGIETLLGEKMEEACRINEAYIKHVTTGIPFVTAKFAMSLDGKIATHTGDSKWISSDESRQYAHNLRYMNDAIMCGVNTILADNPQLTTRCCGGRGGTTKRQPLRVVVDGRGRTPASARIFHEPGETLLAFGRPPTSAERRTFSSLNAEIMEFRSVNGIIDMKELLKWLGKRQIASVLVEGGGVLTGSLFDQGLVDKVEAFVAPIIIGGNGMSPVSGTGVENLAEAYQLEQISVNICGPDIIISGYTSRPGQD
jgi:diaminohydroxyphosphoribosylaminopyrimidine deaminase/5-amino-6-(5-phosphoribosylamino)uracil reductase